MAKKFVPVSSAKDFFDEAIQECEHSQYSANPPPDDSQTQTQHDFTQNEMTQLGESASQVHFSPQTAPPQNPRQVSWGRLIGDAEQYELLPRDPTDKQQNQGEEGTLVLHCLESILPSDVFNEYNLGRNEKKVDICPPKPCASGEQSDDVDKIFEWAHSMVSNRHVKIYCMLDHSTRGVDVYIEDSSGNGTLINSTTLLRKGQKRLLHTGDEICLLNPQPLRKKIRNNPKLIQKVMSKYTYLFVMQQQANQEIYETSASKRKGSPLPAETTKRRAGLVDVKSTAHHSLGCGPTSSGSDSPVVATPRVEQFYDMRDIVGSGTCGQVRRAICRKTGAQYAIKIISLQRQSSVDLQAIQAEASILQSLNHPYIVKLHEYFLTPNEALFLVMELVSGGDLFDRIIDRGSYTEVSARRTMRRLLNAIYYLHQVKSLVHRDLKPENLLCVSKTNDVHIKLTDFGLAKSVTQEGLKTFCGTPQYFAPEVLRRNFTIAGKGRYGKEADMWSLGVILYVLLSGTQPFDVSEGFEVVADSNISFEGKSWKGVSSAAQDLVKLLLVKDPKNRLSVVQACEHAWINMQDGDSHTHPLDDPEAPMRNVPGENGAGEAESATSPDVSKGKDSPTSTSIEESLDKSEEKSEGSPIMADMNSRGNKFREIVKGHTAGKGKEKCPEKPVEEDDGDDEIRSQFSDEEEEVTDSIASCSTAQGMDRSISSGSSAAGGKENKNAVVHMEHTPKTTGKKKEKTVNSSTKKEDGKQTKIADWFAKAK